MALSSVTTRRRGGGLKFGSTGRSPLRPDGGAPLMRPAGEPELMRPDGGALLMRPVGEAVLLRPAAAAEPMRLAAGAELVRPAGGAAPNPNCSRQTAMARSILLFFCFGGRVRCRPGEGGREPSRAGRRACGVG